MLITSWSADKEQKKLYTVKDAQLGHGLLGQKIKDRIKRLQSHTKFIDYLGQHSGFWGQSGHKLVEM